MKKYADTIPTSGESFTITNSTPYGRSEMATAAAAARSLDALIELNHEFLQTFRGRRMSFNMTTGAILDGSKTVTRRVGWSKLKPGDQLLAVDRLRSKNAKRLAVIEVVDVRREPLDEIRVADVGREGYQHMTCDEFVAMFCDAMVCTPRTVITRIEFRYLVRAEQ